MYLSGPVDERIATIAGLQRGRISRRQLHAAGISDRAIHGRVAKDYLHRLHRSVFAVGHKAPMPLGPETAALLACGEQAVLSHHSAVRLWKLLPKGDGPVHVTIRGRNGARPTGVQVHRTATLARAEVRIVERLPVTSPARTLLDCAETLGERELERAVERPSSDSL
jgi:predicted transcriptional regulator of viral defense system